MEFVPPPVLDGWSYSGEFYVAVSGNNKHRRAIIPEIRAIVNGEDGVGDRPGHWYEAQLLHYGLPPSKTKGTAKMRLFDALNKNQLSFPAHILKIEADLKKEWARKQREARRALSQPARPVAAPSPAPNSKKRKVDDKLSKTTPAKPAAKKAEPAASTAAPAAAKKVTATPKAAPKATPKTTAKAAPKTAAPKPTKPVPAPSTPAAPARQKQTARRGTSSTPARARAGASSSRPVAAPPAEEQPRPPRTKQTARRSRPFDPGAYQSRRPTGTAPPRLPQYDATPSQWDHHDDPPPPYSEFPDNDDYDNYRSAYGDSYGDDSRHDHEPLPPLGLLNGRYNVKCTAPARFRDGNVGDSILIFTLEGNELWGYFEIGPLRGVLHLDERPWQSSREKFFFDWRAEDHDGVRHCGTSAAPFECEYVVFLGDGEIAGELRMFHEMIEFEGYRVAGQGTRSEMSVAEMKRKWDEFYV
ncbi:hypothetical protein VTJ49DRAFT_6089 [Mycothermus thermophilus]|uniref:Uncharacterized protein n=1 Tax=Humicola insolens TaxID=85995 RepID=A0ABR3V1W0_HUMIN